MASASLWLCVGCATGNSDWRVEAVGTTVLLRDAGDGRCSPPAPFTSLRACMIHDAAYELARVSRCEGLGDDSLHSEQARLVADLVLAQQMAADGWPELWVGVYYRAVRLGSWWTWHFSPCPHS
jgi:hypothetical protein